MEDVARRVGYKFIENKQSEETVNLNKEEQSNLMEIEGNAIFQNFIKWLSVYLIEFKSIQTLGKNDKSFDAKYNTSDGSLTIVNSKHGPERYLPVRYL